MNGFSEKRSTPDWSSFDAIYLINLVTRPDRRRQITTQLASLNLDSENPRLVWIRAVKPADSGGFESIGIRGCFLSHLECLKQACQAGHQRILILEDDALITEAAAWSTALLALRSQPWNVWYAGARFFGYAPEHCETLCRIASDVSIGTTHCVAFQGYAVQAARDFLELILTRPAGHPEAGPMPVDGAYTVWRRLNTDAITLASMPAVCIQRASRSDITPGLWLDKVPVMRQIVTLLRTIRSNGNTSLGRSRLSRRPKGSDVQSRPASRPLH